LKILSYSSFSSRREDIFLLKSELLLKRREEKEEKEWIVNTFEMLNRDFWPP
jgi:hypothetical protein